MRYITKPLLHPFNSRIQEHFNKMADQTESLLLEHHFAMSVEYCGEVIEDNWTGDKFSLTLKNTKTGKEMSLSYRTGIGHRQVNLRPEEHNSLKKDRSAWSKAGLDDHTCILPPLPLSVLQCIRLDDPQGYTFDDWCADYGYDTDSRKALALYFLCQEQATKFRRTFPGFDLHEYEPLEDY